MSNKFYIVSSKPDDYGAASKELVHTLLKHAKQYYSYKEVPATDAVTLKKYMDFVDADEELERSDDERFYGHE